MDETGGPRESVKVVQASIKLGLAEVVNVVFGVFYFILVTRLFTRLEMAALAVMTVITNLSAIILSFGFHEASRKLLPDYVASGKDGEVRSFLQITWVVIAAASLSLAALVFFLAEPVARIFFKGYGYASLVRLMAWGIISNKWYETAQHNLCALQKFNEMSLTQILSYTVVRIYALALYFLSGIQGYLAGLITGQALLSIWMVAVTRAYFRVPPERKRLSSLFRFSWPFYVNEFVRYGATQADSFLVSVFLRPEVLATYYVVKRFADYLESYVNSILKPLFPKMIELTRSGQESLGKMFFKASRYVSLVNIPPVVLMLSLSYFLLDIYGRGKYLSGLPIFLILNGGMVLHGYQVLCGGAVFVAGRPVDTARMEILQCLVSLVLIVFLTKLTGVTGAATARSLSRLTAILIAWLIGKGLFPWRFDWKGFSGILAISLVAGLVVVMLQWYQYSVIRVCFYLLIGAVLFGLMARKKFTEEDRSLLREGFATVGRVVDWRKA